MKISPKLDLISDQSENESMQLQKQLKSAKLSGLRVTVDTKGF